MKFPFKKAVPIYKSSDFRWSADGLTWYYRRDRYPRCRVVAVLLAEYALRELLQREEGVEIELKALRKAAASETENPRTQELVGELEEIQRILPQHEYTLYREESMLGYDPRRAYDVLGQDDMWIALIDLDVVVGAVVVANEDPHRKGQMAGAIVPQSVGAVQSTGASNFQTTTRKISEMIWLRGCASPICHLQQ
ncbi:uncharacterized protein N7483_012468 [Penicillium malachiteum]|uniref:uncharacterized protein n=1 Tax=Penicillium malachiteum TaxID=1324776 RepID=UPI00254935FB|nr:uncharacterized protein N7483_012468 [Penicillium malachiteum]KAJ5715287.1 hypothetical protein N7483_012468 [Penicillium malachiteum]